MSDAETEIRGRWQHQRPGSGAFELVDGLRAEGHTILPPKVHKPGKRPEPVLRLVAKSVTGNNFTAYINTSSMTVNTKDMVEVVKLLPGADAGAAMRSSFRKSLHATLDDRMAHSKGFRESSSQHERELRSDCSCVWA